MIGSNEQTRRSFLDVQNQKPSGYTNLANGSPGLLSAKKTSMNN